MKMSVLWCIWIASISGIHKKNSVKKIPTQRPDHGVLPVYPNILRRQQFILEI